MATRDRSNVYDRTRGRHRIALEALVYRSLDHALRLLGHGVVHVSGHPLLLYEVVAPSPFGIGDHVHVHRETSGGARFGQMMLDNASLSR